MPDCWFEVGPGEDLEQRATESLTDHFRKEEREEEGFRDPDRLSLKGRAWVTTLELDVEPNQVIEDPKKVLYARLGDDEVLDGETAAPRRTVSRSAVSRWSGACAVPRGRGRGAVEVAHGR
jgi:hypothetical protein